MSTARLLIPLFILSLLGGSCSSGSSSGFIGRKCFEPENPYSEGSGHYAGYEWGASGKSCGGNSSSFIDGCETFEEQEQAYQDCLR